MSTGWRHSRCTTRRVRFGENEVRSDHVKSNQNSLNELNRRFLQVCRFRSIAQFCVTRSAQPFHRDRQHAGQFRGVKPASDTRRADIDSGDAIAQFFAAVSVPCISGSVGQSLAWPFSGSSNFIRQTNCESVHPWRCDGVVRSCPALRSRGRCRIASRS